MTRTDQKVSLARRFGAVDDEHLRNYEAGSLWGYEPRGVLGWDDLLDRSPVLVLAEGKAGKTYEFSRQVEHLQARGDFAFFVPLEQLHDHSVREVLSVEQEVQFDDWRRASDTTGYFFLDAIDELKLRDGSFRIALNKVRREIGPHVARARLFLSCRPGDPTVQFDLAELKPFSVPLSHQAQTPVAPDGETAFLAVMSKGEAHVQESTEQARIAEDIVAGPLVVSLLPLTNEEVRDFATAYASHDAEAFCDALEKNELWNLYRLPYDITEGLDFLAAHGTLGSLEDQMKSGIDQKLAERPGRVAQTLSATRAREGAERLALALFLMKKRSLLSNSAGDPEILNVSHVLRDWAAPERAELVSKALFDPSGVGAVRFHHRATQEYLAACRLNTLREKGLSTRALFALLFDEISGEDVIKPSMEPVVAWLALWHSDVLREVKRRKPHLLFREGLPGAMSVDLREELLRCYVARFKGSGWRSAGVGQPQLKRIGHPGLGPVVRDLWAAAYTGHDTLELLLELIWLTPLPDCMDLALSAMQDVDLPFWHRIYAAYGVLAGGTDDQKQILKTYIVRGRLPEEVVRHLLFKLYPSVLSIDEFINLIRGLTEVPASVHGLGYSIWEAVKNKGQTSANLTTLRGHFTKSIWDARSDESRMYEAHSEFDHFADALLVCCSATVPQTGEDFEAWAWSLAVALHFGERRESIIAKQETELLLESVGARSDLREAYFWACLKMSDALEGRSDDRGRFGSATSESGGGLRPTRDDLAWLLAAIMPSAPTEKRGVAYYALLQLIDLHEDTKIVAKVAQAIADRDDLAQHFHVVLNPAPHEPDEWEIERAARKKEREKVEAERVQGWLDWRAEVLADPEFMLNGEQRHRTIINGHKVVQEAGKGNDTRVRWNGGLLERVLSPEFVVRLRIELSAFWREQDVLLRSERPAEKRGTFLYDWLCALDAVQSEAETEGWATRLTPEEARRATRISCMEINGFAGFIDALEAAHPLIVADVITTETVAQWRGLLVSNQATMLGDVSHHGTVALKSAVAQALVTEFAGLSAEAIENGAHSIEYGVGLIVDHGRVEDAETLRAEVLARLEKNDEATGFWLKQLAHLDMAAASTQLLALTQDLSPKGARERAASLFVSVFGDRFSSRTSKLDDVSAQSRLALLQELVIRACQVVRSEGDTRRERDDADEVRSALFDHLIRVQLPETVHVLHEFAERPEFAHMPDRLREMANELAAHMSDNAPMPLSAFSALDDNASYIPYDDASLVKIIGIKLDEFEHDLLHSDDSPVDTLRKVEEETELRRFITGWLRNTDRGAFGFTQEEVTNAEKRTDIRLRPNSMPAHAAIELKLDDTRHRWSGSQLEHALREQLVGRYLNHDLCRVGCLLIVMRETRHWENPQTGAKMTLAETVTWLQGIADAICIKRPELRLLVKGIDCVGVK